MPDLATDLGTPAPGTEDADGAFSSAFSSAYDIT